MVKDNIKKVFSYIEKYFIAINVIVLIAVIVTCIIVSCLNVNHHWLIWEAAALCVFFFFNLILLSTGLSDKNTWTHAFEKPQDILIIVVLYIPITLLFYFAIKSLFSMEPIVHLGIVSIMTLIFFLIDLIVYKNAKKRLIKEMDKDLGYRVKLISEDFEKSMHYIDLPTIIAFFVLLITFLIRSFNSSTEEMIDEAFIGGAIAFQLVASVVVFIFISSRSQQKLRLLISDKE